MGRTALLAFQADHGKGRGRMWTISGAAGTLVAATFLGGTPGADGLSQQCGEANQDLWQHIGRLGLLT